MYSYIAAVVKVNRRIHRSNKYDVVRGCVSCLSEGRKEKEDGVETNRR